MTAAERQSGTIEQHVEPAVGQVFLAVKPSTRGFLLSGAFPAGWYEAVTCTFGMKRLTHAVSAAKGQNWPSSTWSGPTAHPATQSWHDSIVAEF